MIAFPNCKINLGLHILRKRKDGFHDLETIFYPFPLTDALEIVQHEEQQVKLTVTGMQLNNSIEENICYKAYQLLKKDYPQLPSVNIHLHKVIPAGAGLGGGSADGSFMLMMLNNKFNLQLSQHQLMDYALQIGSDCPFFIVNEPCLATGRGEKMEKIPLQLDQYQIVLVHPGIHVNTAWAFSQIHPREKRNSLLQNIQQPVSQWKDLLVNDFEGPVFKAFPAVQLIRDQLYTAGALFASMSGSGSSVFGIFEKGRTLSLSFPPGYLVRSF